MNEGKTIRQYSTKIPTCGNLTEIIAEISVGRVAHHGGWGSNTVGVTDIEWSEEFTIYCGE